MKLLLVRHGSTFEEGTVPVMIGGHDDPSLTAKGFEQARVFGWMLVSQKIRPRALYSSPLRRAREFALEVIREAEFDFEPVLTEALREIDYGLWTGKTAEEIQKEFGYETWRAWQEESRRPDGTSAWAPTEERLLNLIFDFTDGLLRTWPEDSTLVLVGSAGVLRYFFRLIPGEWTHRVETKSFKVSPGNYGELLLEDGQWKCASWNKAPD